MNRRKTYTEYFTLYCWLMVLPFQAYANTMVMDEVSSGTLLEKTAVSGEYRQLPIVDTDVKISVTGPLARTVLTQTFKNPGSKWTEAIYAFPLPEKAAVDHLDLIVGERVIQGQIKEKKEAKKIYTQAKSEGKKTALVEQHRPNLFTTSVANIPPNGKVEIKLQYQQQLVWRDQQFSLHFPMAITPRYMPAESLPATESIEFKQQVSSGWSILPGEIPNVVPLESRQNSDISNSEPKTQIHVSLDTGFPLAKIDSRYHEINQQMKGQGVTEISLKKGSVLPDRDFVLEWAPKPSFQPKAAFFKEHKTIEEGVEEYGLLMVMPPEIASQLPDIARETIFIIDTSGSMGGASIRQARDALVMAISRLEAKDSFNVIEFNSFTSALFSAPRKANASNKQAALEFVRKLDAGGGTEMLPALKKAFRMRSDDSSGIQQVIFITDGAVGNEQQLLSYIHAELNQRRLFTVGIGSAPNSYFMKEAAHFGRGTYSFIGSPLEVKDKMQALFNRIEKPVLTQLVLETDVEVKLLPEKLPDLYVGEPLSVAIKMDTKQGQELKKATLKGRLGNAEWTQQLMLTNAAEQGGLAVHWGREEIHHWMQSGIKGLSEEKVRQNVLNTALKHHLVSKYTSLVAVDISPSRPVEESLKNQPVNGVMPAGFSSVNQQSLMLASGSTNSMAFILLGMLMLSLGLVFRLLPGVKS